MSSASAVAAAFGSSAGEGRELTQLSRDPLRVVDRGASRCDAADYRAERERRQDGRGEDRGECFGIRGPADGEHEDESDVVRLPDRAHRPIGVLATSTA